MTPKDRHEQARRLSEKYRKASRKEKATMLDGFCLTTRLNRKYAIGLLREPSEKPPQVSGPRRRKQRYGIEVIKVLETIWEAADFPWSVRLKAMISLWLPHLRKRMSVSAKTEAALLTISPRTIDRRLKSKRMATRRRLYGRTKPGTLLKHQIPIRTERWDVGEPGWGEIDLVSHSGSCADGEFAHSMNFTDIHSTWVETRAVLTKAQAGVIEGLDSMRNSLPFRMCGLDSDNGSEFINNHVFRYCQSHKIQFTPRPAVQEGRQRAHRTEELDSCSTPGGMGTDRLTHCRRSSERSLLQRVALDDESLSAFGEAGSQGADWITRSSRLRRSGHPSGSVAA
jgi:hypothetical protein